MNNILLIWQTITMLNISLLVYKRMNTVIRTTGWCRCKYRSWFGTCQKCRWIMLLRYIYNIVDLFCENGFVKAISCWRQSRRCEMRWLNSWHINLSNGWILSSRCLVTVLTFIRLFSHTTTSWKISPAQNISCHVTPFIYYHSVVIQNFASYTLYRTNYFP